MQSCGWNYTGIELQTVFDKDDPVPSLPMMDQASKFKYILPVQLTVQGPFLSKPNRQNTNNALTHCVVLWIYVPKQAATEPLIHFFPIKSHFEHSKQTNSTNLEPKLNLRQDFVADTSFSNLFKSHLPVIVCQMPIICSLYKLHDWWQKCTQTTKRLRKQERTRQN